MATTPEVVQDLARPGARREFASQLIASDRQVAQAVARELELGLGSDALGRVERVWGLSGAEVAKVFGVSREAYRKWRARGVPADRTQAVAELDHATQVLLEKLVIDRIPAVVRRPAEVLGGRSLLDVALADGPAVVGVQVDRMFDLRRLQP
jgi:hypothetical protein